MHISTLRFLVMKASSPLDIYVAKNVSLERNNTLKLVFPPQLLEMCVLGNDNGLFVCNMIVDYM